MGVAYMESPNGSIYWGATLVASGGGSWCRVERAGGTLVPKVEWELSSDGDYVLEWVD